MPRSARRRFRAAVDRAEQYNALMIAISAIAVRALICAIVLHRCHLSIDGYARLYDGNSYLITAEAMTGDWHAFNAFHGRVFPGYPAMLALLHGLHIPFAVGAIAVDWIGAAAAAALAAVLFHDRRVGWAMALLIPHYVMNSALAMSESPMLALTLGSLLMISHSRPVSSGALLGIAMTVRPMACFAGAGCLVAEFTPHRPAGTKRLLRVGTIALTAAMVLLTGMYLLHRWRGTALAGARYYASSPNTYDGQLLTWPFHSLLSTPFRRHVPIGRMLYIYAHVGITLLACGLLLRKLLRYRRHLDWRDALAGPWLLSNTFFVLCVGSIWGFECFHRFTIPALPAMFWALRSVLPARRRFWIPIAIASTVIAWLTVTTNFFNNGCT